MLLYKLEKKVFKETATKGTQCTHMAASTDTIYMLHDNSSYEYIIFSYSFFRFFGIWL